MEEEDRESEGGWLLTEAGRDCEVGSVPAAAVGGADIFFAVVSED